MVETESVTEHVANCRQLVCLWLAEALRTKSVLLTEQDLRPLADRLLAVAVAIRATP